MQERRSLAQMFDLSQQAALVTGAARGIGQAIAYRLAEAGARVMVADIDAEAAYQTAHTIQQQGGKAEVFDADLRQTQQAEAVVGETVEAFGSIDILVNNAGIFPSSPALLLTEEQWDQVMDLNLKGAFFCAQAAAHAMIELRRPGTIINIASIDAMHPSGNLAHYDASKGGLVMLTRSLAQEWSEYQIRVNAIAPGAIRTPGVEAMSGNVALNAFQKRIPLGRIGEPDDIASMALFLASPAASYMTGSVVVVDGGFLLS